MKLYFYIMVQEYGTQPRIAYEECDVIERPKTYKPKDKFPSGFYRSYVRKDEIGHVINNFNKAVILLEKNADRARQLLSDQYRKEIENLRKTLNEKEELLSTAEAFEG